MIRAIADTHAVIWYLYDDPRLSPSARTAFEEASAEGELIGFSSITLIEIVYLVEKGRIKAKTLERLFDVLETRETGLVEIPVDRSVAKAMQGVLWSQVPDMPDRIIAATALAQGMPIISRDAKIRVVGIPTIW